MSVMPANENPETAARQEQEFDESVSELAAFSNEQLAAMNKVLISLLHAVSLPELLDCIHKHLADAGRVSACAHYVPIDGHLRIEYGAGEYNNSLPEVVASDSDVLASMRSSKYAKPVGGAPLQPSLFEDAPVVSFWAIESEGDFAGAFACVHAAESVDFVNAVCRQIVVTMDTLYKSPHAAKQVPKEIVAQVVDMEPISSVIDRLTEREQEVLTLLCQGLGNKEIAAKLYISLPTCKHHVENILIKLGVHSRAAAVAVGLGLTRTRTQ